MSNKISRRQALAKGAAIGVGLALTPFVKAEKPAGAEKVSLGCIAVRDCFELVAGRKKSSRGYRLLENYIYPRAHMQVWNMAEQRIFGDLTYGAGAYIHEVRNLRFTQDGKLTWRGRNVLNDVGV